MSKSRKIQKPHTRPKNIPKARKKVEAPPKPKRASPELEFRNLSLTEDELLWMLKVLVMATDFPYVGLKQRMIDLAGDFRDQGLKMKEMLIRAKANSFWMQPSNSSAELLRLSKGHKKKMRQEFKDLQVLTAKEIKRILESKAEG